MFAGIGSCLSGSSFLTGTLPTESHSPIFYFQKLFSAAYAMQISFKAGLGQGRLSSSPLCFSNGLFHFLVYTVKQNQSKAVPLPKTSDCLIPGEECLNCIIHCLMQDRAFNYGLIIFADVDPMVTWFLVGSCGMEVSCCFFLSFFSF